MDRTLFVSIHFVKPVLNCLRVRVKQISHGVGLKQTGQSALKLHTLGMFATEKEIGRSDCGKHARWNPARTQGQKDIYIGD